MAAAAMILDHLQGDTSHLAEARERVRAREQGLSLLELRHLLEREHVAATGVDTDFATLATLRMPVVAHVPDHFLIVDSIGASGVYVRDPARGRLLFGVVSFVELWTGRALVFGLDPQHSAAAVSTGQP